MQRNSEQPLTMGTGVHDLENTLHAPHAKGSMLWHVRVPLARAPLPVEGESKNESMSLARGFAFARILPSFGRRKPPKCQRHHGCRTKYEALIMIDNSKGTCSFTVQTVGELPPQTLTWVGTKWQ